MRWGEGNLPGGGAGLGIFMDLGFLWTWSVSRRDIRVT